MDSEAFDRIAPEIYDELRAVAAWHMRHERAEHTLQPTGLVHEVWLRMVEQKRASWKDRAHFIAIATRQMRRILVDYGRRHGAAKRGSGFERVALETVAETEPVRAIDFVELDHALIALEQADPQACRVVELRFFGGLTVEETAEVLNISPTTVKRDWHTARLWLYSELLRGDANDTPGMGSSEEGNG